MAITYKSSGRGLYQPGYDQNVHVFDSTNKDEPGFRYVIDIYEVSPSGVVGSKIYEGRVAPRPNDGWGYIDVQKIVSNYIEGEVNLNTSTVERLFDNIFSYEIRIGEEYIESWEYWDSEFQTGSITKLVSTMSAHPFSQGDAILIVPDDVDIFPQLQGLHNVLENLGTYSFSVNVPFVSTATNPGYVKFADNRTTIFRDLYSSDYFTVWNAASRFTDVYTIDYDTEFIIKNTSTTNRLSTNYPDNFWMTPEQDAYLYALIVGASQSANDVYAQNDEGDLWSTSIPLSETISIYHSIPFGPNNIGGILVSGTGSSLVKDTTKYYDVWIVDDNPGPALQLSKKYRVWIDRRCKLSDYEILFEDRMGSYLSYAFSGRSRKSGNISREQFNRQIGNFVASSENRWLYDISDSGTIINSVSYIEDIELNTLWMTYEMDNYFEELLTSPNTYLKINDGTSNNYVRCLIIDSSNSIEDRKNKDLRMRKIKVRYAVQNNINI